MKVLAILVINISDKRQVQSRILENGAVLAYALFVFPVAALDNLFNTIKFCKQAPLTDKPTPLSSPCN